MDLADVTVHIDETLAQVGLDSLEKALRQLDGVVAVGRRADKPHLMVVEFNPDKLRAADIGRCLREEGVHAELIGL